MLDISCFFLMEDSGDSELDFKSSMDITRVTEAGSGGDEDDAESCSCDTIDTVRLDDFYQAILKFLDDDDGDDQDWMDCKDDEHGDGRPGLGMDLCGEVMDGMEDRLFWETCMAVGFP